MKIIQRGEILVPVDDDSLSSERSFSIISTARKMQWKICQGELTTAQKKTILGRVDLQHETLKNGCCSSALPLDAQLIRWCTTPRLSEMFLLYITSLVKPKSRPWKMWVGRQDPFPKKSWLTERQRMMKGCTITETKRSPYLGSMVHHSQFRWEDDRSPLGMACVNELNKRTKGDKY